MDIIFISKFKVHEMHEGSWVPNYLQTLNTKTIHFIASDDFHFDSLISLRQSENINKTEETWFIFCFIVILFRAARWHVSVQVKQWEWESTPTKKKKKWKNGEHMGKTGAIDG